MRRMPLWQRLLALAALAAALAGCATTYRENNLFNRIMVGPGGYQVDDLGGDRYQVTIVANLKTTRETMRTYWLMRCAELTLEKKLDAFVLDNPEVLAGSEGGLRAAKFIYIPIYTPSGGGPQMQGFGAQVTLKRKPFDAQPPQSFDAATLKTALDRVMKAPTCDAGNICPHEATYLKAQGAPT